MEFWKPSIADARLGFLFYTILPVHKRAFSQRLLLEFFVQKLFRTNLNFRSQGGKKMRKNQGRFHWFCSISKVEITKLSLFFQIFYSLVSKIEICLKYFWTKIPKSSHFAWFLTTDFCCCSTILLLVHAAFYSLVYNGNIERII